MRTVFFSLLSWCPGALGLFLRQRFLPLFFGSCGRGVLFGRFIRLYGGRAIQIGDNAVISDRVTLDGRSGSGAAPKISIGSRVFIGAGCRLHSRGGEIVIGQGSSLGSFCLIASRVPVILEEEVLLAAFCSLGPGGPRRDAAGGVPEAGPAGEIVLGRGSWLGVRSSVLPGVRVGEGTVVGAHALVRDSLPAKVVAVGRPARVIRERSAGGRAA